MLSSRSFIILHLGLWSILSLFLWRVYGLCLDFFTCGCLIDPASFVGDIILFTLFWLYSFVKNHLTIFMVNLLDIKLTLVCGASDDWISLEFLSLKLIHTKPQVIYRLQFRFSYPSFNLNGSFHLWASAPGNWDSLYSVVCLSNLKDSVLTCDLTSLRDLRRVVDFSFCSAFTC